MQAHPELVCHTQKYAVLAIGVVQQQKQDQTLYAVGVKVLDT